MSPDKAFVAIVQTGALVGEMMRLREGRVPNRRAVACVARATQIPESAFPRNAVGEPDAERAANEFLDYAMAERGAEPDWYATWRDYEARSTKTALPW